MGTWSAWRQAIFIKSHIDQFASKTVETNENLVNTNKLLSDRANYYQLIFFIHFI